MAGRLGLRSQQTTTMLDTITIYRFLCTFLIALCFIHACFSTSIHVVLFVKSSFCSSDYLNFLCHEPKPDPVRFAFEGFYFSYYI